MQTIALFGAATMFNCSEQLLSHKTADTMLQIVFIFPK